MTGPQMWGEIAESIRSRIGQLRFNLWFRDLTVVAFDGETLAIGVPNPLHRAWLLHQYVPMLQQAIAATGRDVSLDMVLLPAVQPAAASNEPSIRVLTRAQGVASKD